MKNSHVKTAGKLLTVAMVYTAIIIVFMLLMIPNVHAREGLYIEAAIGLMLRESWTKDYYHEGQPEFEGAIGYQWAPDPKLDVFVEYNHRSKLFNGLPENDRKEPTGDKLQAGVRWWF